MADPGSSVVDFGPTSIEGPSPPIVAATQARKASVARVKPITGRLAAANRSGGTGPGSLTIGSLGRKGRKSRVKG